MAPWSESLADFCAARTGSRMHPGFARNIFSPLVHAPSSRFLGGMNALPGLHADQLSQDLGVQLARANGEGGEGGGLGVGVFLKAPWESVICIQGGDARQLLCK